MNEYNDNVDNDLVSISHSTYHEYIIKLPLYSTLTNELKKEETELINSSKRCQKLETSEACQLQAIMYPVLQFLQTERLQ